MRLNSKNRLHAQNVFRSFEERPPGPTSRPIFRTKRLTNHIHLGRTHVCKEKKNTFRCIVHDLRLHGSVFFNQVYAVFVWESDC